MKGVQFVVDDKGQQTGVVIDLREYKELWEDCYDAAVARTRHREPRESLAAVKRRLRRIWEAPGSMSQYEITFARSARRELEALSRPIVARVSNRIEALSWASFCFRTPTVYGQKMVFIPRGPTPWFWKRHPVAEELRSLVLEAGGAPSVPTAG